MSNEKNLKPASLSNYRAQCFVGQFIQVKCENLNWVRTKCRVLYQAFIAYFEKMHGCPCPISETFFGRELTRRGIMSERTTAARYRVGIALKSVQAEEKRKREEAYNEIIKEMTTGKGGK